MKNFLKEIIPVLLCLTFLLFGLLFYGLGDPLILSQAKSGEHVDLGQSKILEERYGLDRPFIIQYADWISNILQGDLGNSYLDGRPVFTLIKERVPATVILMTPALIGGFILALGAGIWSAVYPHMFLSKLFKSIEIGLLSLPIFLSSLFLLQLFSLQLNWLPTGGMAPLGEDFSWSNDWIYLLLPSSILAVYYAVGIVGMIRQGMTEVLQQEYIRTAYICRIPKWRIVLEYGLHNALLPIITLVMLSLPRFFAGSFIIEYLFSWPGMGRLVIDSAFQRDYPVLLGVVLLLGVIVIVSNCLAEELYRLADPTVKESSLSKRGMKI